MPSAIVARLAMMLPTVAQALPACARLTFTFLAALTAKSRCALSCREQEFEKLLPGKNGARSYTKLQSRQLPCSGDLDGLRIPARREGGGQVRLEHLIWAGAARRQQPGSKNCCG